MGVTQTVAPSGTPVTLSQLKTHLRILNTEQDGLLDSILPAATQYCEERTRRQFLTATWQKTLDRFPSGTRDRIELPLAPLASVSSITYVDTDGDTQTWATSEFIVDTTRDPGQIALVFSKTWPVARVQLNSVTITYIAGYGGVNDVPDTAKQAIKLIAAHYYSQPEPFIVGTTIARVPETIDALLGTLRVVEVDDR